MIRSLRETALSLVRVSGVSRVLRMRERAPVFCFHNVTSVSWGRGDRSLHVPVADFRRYAAWIADTYRVVPLAELVQRVASRGRLGGVAAITFDDAYAGVLEHALPALSALGVPATVFVVSSATETPRPFWWDLLAGADGLGAEARERCLEDLAGDRESCLSTFRVPDDPDLPSEFLPATWEQLSVVPEGVDLGVHTATHRNLARLHPGEAEAELGSCLRVLKERFGAASPLVSYPYGRHTGSVVAAARRIGFEGGVVLGGRLAGPDDDPMTVPRITVPAGITLDALECRAVDLQRFWWRGE